VSHNLCFHGREFLTEQDLHMDVCVVDNVKMAISACDFYQA
jgi:hypothetical protein